MKKIKKVIIKNFQSHKDRTVEFDDFTAIVGPSDKGKTAIMRAITWALYNTPSGNSFITRGEDTCTVTVVFDDGLEIVRTKGSKENSYDIKFCNNEVIHLESFGVGSIDTVVEAHGMREIDVFSDRQALNLCKQLDEPFFLGESAVNKAAVIGKLAKTEVIDIAIKNTTNEIRQKKAISKDYKERLKKIKAEQKELTGLSVLKKTIDVASKKIDILLHLSLKISSISSIIGKIENLNKQIDILNELALKSIDSVEIIELIDDSIDILQKTENIRKIVSVLDSGMNKLLECKNICSISQDEINLIITKIDEAIESCKDISSIKLKNKKILFEKEKLKALNEYASESEFNEVIKSIDSCINKVENVSKISKVNEKLKAFNSRKESGVSVINKISESYSKLINEYKSELKESKECPTCGADIENVDKILEDL